MSKRRGEVPVAGGGRHEGAAGDGAADTLRARLSVWWRNLPLMRSFACYTAICLVLSVVISVAFMVACLEGYHYLDRVENEGRTEVDSGPYIYDVASGELVPAVSVDLGSGVGDRMVYVGMRRGTGRASVETDKGSPQVINASTERPVVYATLERIASDDGLKLYDWGGNYTEADYIEAGGNPYNPKPIAADELAHYDERERRERISTTGELGSAIEQLGAANDEILTSNIGYYVSQAQTSTETTPMFALRIAAGLAPFVVLGVLATVLFRQFYRVRLAEPLGSLHHAAERIAAQDLDFTVGTVAGREFAGLASAFERMRASLEEAQRELFETAEERRRLNAAFAHDLRTPVTVLKGTLEMMEDKEPSPHIATLQGQVERLESYAQAMTGITKLEDREVERGSVAFSVLAGDLGRTARTLASETGIACHVAVRNELADVCGSTGAAELCVDASLVEEVLGNVMSNACRFARQRVSLAVCLRRRCETDGEKASAPDETEGALSAVLDLRVTDDGPGFSAEALRRGCESFFSEQKSAEHFGLGLTVASMLARLHGGSLELANTTSGGALVHATFAVELAKP